MPAEQIKPKSSRNIILILGLIILLFVAGYAYYSTQQFLAQQSESGKITPTAVARELAAIAIEFLKKTFDRYRGG